MTFPLFLQAKERTVMVVGMVDKENHEKETGVFIDGKGYIDENDRIWIYSGQGKPRNSNEYPYFWFNQNGEKEFSNPDDTTKNLFTRERLVSYDMKVILNETKEGEELHDERAINDMNNASAFFIPIILSTDDFLKKSTKRAIIDKKININRLKYKMDEKYILPNMSAALKNKTKMSVNYFTIWAELLGIDFILKIVDSGSDTLNPLKEPLYYLSYKDDVFKESELDDTDLKVWGSADINRLIRIVNNLTEMGMSLENALIAVELDEKTYKKYSN